MKKILFLIIAISFLSLPDLRADNSELEKLRAENEAAIKKVVERYEANLKIIDRAYLAQLVKMKKFFIKKGDLNGAVAVRDEINTFKEKLGLPDKETKEEPEKEEKVKVNKTDNTDSSTQPEDEGGNDATKNNGDGNKVHGEEEF